MKPERALELVARYASLTKQIKSLTIEIGASLRRCKGVDGKRDGFANMDDRHVDSKSRDIRTHLWAWYNEPVDHHMDGEAIFDPITPGQHGMTCCHCYNAHLAIQLRKRARKDLGIVKGAISRSIS